MIPSEALTSSPDSNALSSNLLGAAGSENPEGLVVAIVVIFLSVALVGVHTHEWDFSFTLAVHA
jgi:hypothetical protein